MSQSDLSKLRHIKCIVMDVDGVLTDGTVQVTEAGDSLRTFNIKDGYAIQHAVKQGYKLAVISGGTSNGVRLRMEKLGLTEIHMSVKNKKECFADLCKRWSVDPKDCLFMGDEMIDLEPLEMAGISYCPIDAADHVREACMFVSSKKGGDGCVREIIEKIMILQGTWVNADSFVW